MKSTLFLLLLGFSFPLAAQEALNPSDREALLERLEKIKADADARVDARFRTAMSAFRSAVSSPNAALDLYLACEEKANFEDKDKSNVDFREWKRTQTERLSDPGFRLALQHQLQWLILTLEAASEDADKEKLAVSAARAVEAIVSDAKELSGYRDIVRQSVTGSVFARRYEINGIKVENWPLAPGDIQGVYEQVLLPPLRRPDRLASLRDTWMKRMVHESELQDTWSGKPGEKVKSGARSPEYEKFVSETLPRMRWDCEIDLFKSGDERGAAKRMLSHIEANLTHQDAPKWAEAFTNLLKSETTPAEPAPTPAAP